jgi:drug/metabolite transporter (DMT)-like permease
MKFNFDVPGHIYILLTLAFTVYGQLVLKWQMGSAGPLPAGALDKLLFLSQQFMNPWIFSGFCSAFVASLAWMAAMTRFELNYAYPFMSLAFVIVMILGVLFLGEAVNLRKVLGTLLVVLGLVVIARA